MGKGTVRKQKPKKGGIQQSRQTDRVTTKIQPSSGFESCYKVLKRVSMDKLKDTSHKERILLVQRCKSPWILQLAPVSTSLGITVSQFARVQLHPPGPKIQSTNITAAKGP
jgi:hypothetical protein